MLSLVVNERGLPENIHVVSPLGFGLDEKAEEAIAKWRFVPGTKEGKPVPVIAQIQVNFRFPQIWFDEKAEKRRTSFNVALKSLAGDNQAAKERAVKTVEELASQHFAPAMFLEGKWLQSGENGVGKDEAEGLHFIQKAASAKYGPALFEVAMQALKAGGDPSEIEKQRQNMRDAALLGSTQAQFYLGEIYEAGIGAGPDPDRARRYFRLCAAKGVALCEYRLGRLLMAKGDASNDDYAQGVAWLELAAEQEVAEARTLLQQEQPKLSAAQTELVQTWKTQLRPKS